MSDHPQNSPSTPSSPPLEQPAGSDVVEEGPHEPSPVTLQLASDHSDRFRNMSFIPPDPWSKPIPPSPDRIVIHIKDHIGTGALSKVYSAVIYSNGWMTPCIYKRSNLAKFVDRGKGEFGLSDARNAVLNEAAVYKELGDCGLQGTLVPRYWGIAVLEPPGAALEDGLVYCSVMEDGGKAMPYEERLNPETQERIREMYRILHAAGVIHVDHEWRHVLRDDTGRLLLIDFDQSVIKQDRSDEYWQMVSRLHMREIEDIFA